ncbi:MAG: Ig-like domain-containing protein [Solirubrobacteraceae bacterium]
MTARQILRIGMTALSLLLAGSSASAVAQAQALAGVPPTLEIQAPPSPSSDTTPYLTGTAASAPGDATSVVVTVTGGATPYIATVPVRAGSWSLTLPTLAQGTYTASATQIQVGRVTVRSNAVSFSVDLTAPALTLSTSTAGSAGSGPVLLGGQAGAEAGDLPSVTVQVYAGSTITLGETPVEAITVQAAGGKWSAAVAGLAPGEYVARAEQSDLAGNVAVTASASFEILASVTSSAANVPGASTTPPSASFTWLPAKPHVDEPVALLSTSLAGSSPLTEAAWATTATGPFELVGLAHSLTFTSPGKHLVRLKVTAADGQTSSISKELSILPRAAGMMDPFPVVQLAGSYARGGMHLKELRVEVPSGTHAAVRCIGRGCRMAWEKYNAPAGHGSIVGVHFHSFERFLPAGVELVVTVFQGEEIGKMTRLYVRSGRPPRRIDTCVNPAGAKPMACPA